MRQEVREENRTICSAFDARLASSVPRFTPVIRLELTSKSEGRIQKSGHIKQETNGIIKPTPPTKKGAS